MSAYFLFDNLELRDGEKLAEYARLVAPVVARYGGRYRIVGGATKVVEGDWRPAYPVLIESDAVAEAETWYNSPEYTPLKRLRQSAVTCNGVLIEGI